eukprot:2964306-Lingulodinium_polyedra.AAC.1
MEHPLRGRVLRLAGAPLPALTARRFRRRGEGCLSHSPARRAPGCRPAVVGRRSRPARGASRRE